MHEFTSNDISDPVLAKAKENSLKSSHITYQYINNRILVLVFVFVLDSVKMALDCGIISWPVWDAWHHSPFMFGLVCPI